jgi:hypothetical protein
MEQVARNATMQDTGYLNDCRYLLHDRDKKFCPQLRETLAAGGVKCTPIPSEKSESERPRGTLGLFHQRGRSIVSCPISWFIITNRETTKAKAIFYSSPPLCRRQVREARSVVESGSAAYSNTTAALHEYFRHARASDLH